MFSLKRAYQPWNHRHSRSAHKDSHKHHIRIRMATTTQRAPDGVEAIKTSDEKTALSQEYDTPMGLAHTTMTVLKDRIKQHYDLASDYYLNLWYVLTPSQRFFSQGPIWMNAKLIWICICRRSVMLTSIQGRAYTPWILSDSRVQSQRYKGSCTGQPD